MIVQTLRAACALTLISSGVAAQPAKQPAISAETSAKIPDAGILFTHGDAEDLVVAKLTRNGVITLARVAKVTSALWRDATTLVVLRQPSERAAELQIYVDGKLDPARSVMRTEITKVLGSEEHQLEFVLGANTDAWVTMCLKFKNSDVPDSPCANRRWVRIDVADAKPVGKKPAGLRAVPPVELKRLPRVAPPAGVVAKVTRAKFYNDHAGAKIAGIDCTGPAGKSILKALRDEGPAETLIPEKLQFVNSKPPIFAVEGTVVDPIDMRSRAVWYFEPCNAAPVPLMVLRPGIWAKGTGDPLQWTIHVEDQPVATLRSDWVLDIAPSP